MANRTMGMVSPKRDQGPQYPPQGSVYSLTFDEVQSQLGNTGKPLHSMNLDELLKNLISAESEQQLVENHACGNIGNLNGTLSNETINGTIEDLLARAGFINIGNQNNVIGDTQPLAFDPMVIGSQQEDWLPLQMQMHQQQNQQIMGLCQDFCVSKHENPVGYSEISVPITTMSMSSTCSDSKGGAFGRKRMYSDEMLEKTIERRQKRMAKNRESAARSRAKKQEHIDKLEDAKFRLQKLNSGLEKEKELDAQRLAATTPTPKYQLRRTSSTTF